MLPLVTYVIHATHVIHLSLDTDILHNLYLYLTKYTYIFINLFRS